jgi:hypothetical protein
MRRLLAVLGLAALAAACTDQATAPPSERPALAADVTQGGGAPAVTLTIEEPGYRAKVVAEGLPMPQGTVQLGNGVLYALASAERQLIRVLPSGAQDIVAAFDAVPGSSRTALVDLIPDREGGLYASMLVSPSSLLSPIWRVGMDRAVTQVAGVPWAATFLALDAAERLHVIQVLRGVVRVEPGGNLTRVISIPLSGTQMRGLTFDEEGRLYVLAAIAAYPHWSEIRRFDLTGADLPIPFASGVLVTAALPLPAPNAPLLQDLVLWPGGGGDLFTVDGDYVYRVRLDGTVSIFASGLQSAGTTGVFNTLALSGAGDLLVTEYAAGRVTRIGR